MMNSDTKDNGGLKYIVAIGASTGGPKCLQSVLSAMRGNVPAAFVVTQHMPKGFTKSFAARLDGVSGLTVKEAEDNEPVKAGHAYIAPGDCHMGFEKTGGMIKIRLLKTPPVGGHRPSIDVMMKSLAGTGFKNIIGVILTGMGRDGSEGIKAIKGCGGGYIIVQDKKTCVADGMPGSAIATGAADAVLPLGDIANEILKIIGGV